MLPSWLAFVIALVLTTLLFPSVRASVFSSDDILEMHEKGVLSYTVAVRAPFRETSSPACMAQLIMMRHKLNQNSGMRKRKTANVSRQPSRTREMNPPRVQRNIWMPRFGRSAARQSR